MRSKDDCFIKVHYVERWGFLEGLKELIVESAKASHYVFMLTLRSFWDALNYRILTPIKNEQTEAHLPRIGLSEYKLDLHNLIIRFFEYTSEIRELCEKIIQDVFHAPSARGKDCSFVSWDEARNLVLSISQERTKLLRQAKSDINEYYKGLIQVLRISTRIDVFDAYLIKKEADRRSKVRNVQDSLKWSFLTQISRECNQNEFMSTPVMNIYTWITEKNGENFYKRKEGSKVLFPDPFHNGEQKLSINIHHSSKFRERYHGRYLLAWMDRYLIAAWYLEKGISVGIDVVRDNELTQAYPVRLERISQQEAKRISKEVLKHPQERSELIFERLN